MSSNNRIYSHVPNGKKTRNPKNELCNVEKRIVLCEQPGYAKKISSSRIAWREMLDLSSPRTLEALLENGILPEELSEGQNPVSEVERKTLSAEMVERKKEWFERRRQEKIAMVVRTREELMKSTKKAETRDVSGAEDGMPSTNLANEARRVEAACRRQARELERMVAGEEKMRELELRYSRDEREAKMREMSYAERLKESRAKTEAREMEREAREEEVRQAEDARAAEISKRERELEAKMEEMEERRRKEHEARTMRKDVERREKMAERTRRSAEALKRIEDLALESREKMLEREARLKEQMDRKKAEKTAEVEAAREASAARVRRAYEQNKAKAEADRAKFAERQREAERRAKEKKEEAEVRAAQVAKDREDRDRRRLARLEDAVTTKKKRREKIVEDRRRREAHYETVSAERERHLELLKLENMLEKEARLDNVNRMRRIDEFRRLKLLRKLQQDCERSNKIKASREDLVDQRKNNAHRAFMRKHQIRTALEAMRVGGSTAAAAKSLDDVMSFSSDAHAGGGGRRGAPFGDED